MDKRKVLVVDDEVDIINALSNILTIEGYKVIAAKSKEEAMKLAKDESPDLAILDVMMAPNMKDLSLLKICLMISNSKICQY